MLSVDEAILSILSHVLPGTLESVPLTNAWQRILGQDVVTPHDSPPFDKSLMDGFAVRSADFFPGSADSTNARLHGNGLNGNGLNGNGLHGNGLHGNGLHGNDGASGAAAANPKGPEGRVSDSDSRCLQVLETITAGRLPAQRLTPGTASRIMTGALLPEGADCVVPVEQAGFDEQHPDQVWVPPGAVSAESCILRKGTAAGKGSVLLSRGCRLMASQIAALAEFGISTVVCYRRPSVAILATGDELLTVDEPLEPGRIRNSNEPMLAAQVLQADATPVMLGIARDNVTDLSKSIRDGLCHDFLLLTGGVSAGTLDLVPARLAAAGVRPVFHGVQMKPGKPLWFGIFESDVRRCFVFGLPGNPVSSLVCFELFVRSAIRQALGTPHPAPTPLTGVLSQSFSVRGARPVYHPVRTTYTENGLCVTPVPWSGSSDLRATVDADGMALLLPSESPYSAGQKVATFPWCRHPWEGR